MALYGKKLHIRKNGVVTDINLWTESWEAGTPALHIRDGVNLVHARLGAVTDGLASDLRVRKDNVVYAVLKNRWVMINIMQSANQTITVNVNGTPHTESFATPYGTAFTAWVTAAAGFSPGAISAASGVANGDVTISATSAVQSLAPGSVSGNGEYNLMIPASVTVIEFKANNDYYYVGVTAGKIYLFRAIFFSYGGKQVGVLTNDGFLRLAGVPYPEGETIPLPIKLSWGPEINAHGPTDGSLA